MASGECINRVIFFIFLRKGCINFFNGFASFDDCFPAAIEIR